MTNNIIRMKTISCYLVDPLTKRSFRLISMKYNKFDTLDSNIKMDLRWLRKYCILAKQNFQPILKSDHGFLSEKPTIKIDVK